MIAGFGFLPGSEQDSADSLSVGEFTSGNNLSRMTNRRIIVVEDEVFVAMAIEDALVSAGATVVGPATSVTSGLELLDSETKLDGAILDINVDNELVFPIAERLRDQGVPIIFHTAYAHTTEMQEAYPEAVICIKPALNEELVALAAARFR